MGNAIYPLWKDAIATAAANSAINGAAPLKVALIDTGTYTYSAAHQFLSDLSGVVGTAQAIGSPTISGGVVDGADVVFSAVTGPTVEALVLYLDTGVPGTSRLVFYADTGFTGSPGLPCTPNGGSISVSWDNGANKIFKL